MKIEQWEEDSHGWVRLTENAIDYAQLILVFCAKDRLEKSDVYGEVRERYPDGDIIICSTSGEIQGNRVADNSIQISAICFDSTTVRSTCISLDNVKDSYQAGVEVVKNFPQEDLHNLLIFSDGQLINGSDLVDGINSIIPDRVLVTGGLAGGGVNFAEALVSLNSKPKEGSVVAVAFYGKNLRVGHGCQGGWDSFGPYRLVTKSAKNVLHELDGQNALELYKNYLGEEAKRLPSSALLFPLKMQVLDSEDSVVRTILSVDKENGTMTFAGNIPEGSKVRLMQANFDRLVDGALNAAVDSLDDLKDDPQFVLLISCVGRKLVLGPRIDEETEAIASRYPDGTVFSGFYSNGEISPINNSMNCELHNQTMTITTFSEVETSA